MGKWKTFKELETEKVRTFNVIDRRYNSVMNINKIHPLKQDKIYHLVTDSDTQDIRKIWIFGSSTNNSCNIFSDIDVLVELKNVQNSNYEDTVCRMHKIFSKSLGSDFDLLVSEELDKNKQFYDNVMKTRRLVYECAD